jgi:hypothetical protein
MQDQPEDGQWTIPAKNYASTRFSTLTDINTETIRYLSIICQARAGYLFARRTRRVTAVSGRSSGSMPFEANGIIQQSERWKSWMAQLLENQISFPMLGYFRSQHSNQAWLTALLAITDYATVIGLASYGSLRLQADLTAAMGRHVVSDVVVIFWLEQSCERTPSSHISGCAEQLRILLLQRSGIFDVSKLRAP